MFDLNSKLFASEINSKSEYYLS